MSWTDAVAAELTTIARARAMAAALPGAGYAEAVYDVPFDEAWAGLTDFERSVPVADHLVARIRVHDRRRLDDGAEQVRMTAWSPLRIPQRFDVRVEDGYCLMRGAGRLFVVVMAAMPEPGGGTRYAHVEAVPRRIGHLLAPFLRRTVRADVAGFGRYLQRSRG